MAGLGLLLAGSVISLINPWMAGQLTGQITGSPESYFSGFMPLVLSWVGLLLLRAVISFATSLITGTAAEIVLAGLRSRLYEHMLLMPVSYYDDQRRGNILSLLSSDAAIISNFVTGTVIQLLPMALTFIGAAGMMFWISPTIALIAVFFVPLYILAMKIVGRRIRPLSRQWVDAYGNLISVVEENLGLLPTIKSYTRENHELENFARKNHLLLTLSRKSLFIHTLLPPLVSLMASLGLLVLAGVGYREISSGQMSAETLVTILFYAMMLNQPLSQLAGAYGQFQNTRGASERILEFLDQEVELRNNPQAALPRIEGHVRFDNVSFCYASSPDQMPINNLHLTIRAGETIAIVGKNGAGKSTFAHLLMRLIDPVAGNILIDGHNIRDVSIASVRAQIGLVAQHTLLLNGTVGENIGWGRALASQEDIEQAAKAACAHDFIVRLPQGYDTLVGDQGLKLSGGQRQRLSLARALLKNPPILILDEATSMFDPAGEYHFLKDCEEVFRHRTVILITHRPASLAIADRVLLLENGSFREITDIDLYLKTGESRSGQTGDANTPGYMQGGPSGAM